MIVIAMGLQFYDGKETVRLPGSGTEQVIPKKAGKGVTALLTVLRLFSLVALGIPVGSNFIMSFSDSFSIEKFRFTLDNYQNVLQMDGASDRRGHSLTLASVAAVIGLLVGSR